MALALQFMPDMVRAQQQDATPAAPAGEYKPVEGQPGKDVVWVPSPSDMVERMLDLAGVTPNDFVIDLGSGDGRNVIAAARRGARALGVEYNPDLVTLSRRNAAAAGVADKASFAEGDMFEADISQASVMMLFLLPANLSRLADRFLTLKPGSRIVANTFGIASWNPDEIVRMEDGCYTWCSAMLYVVPAKVAGQWTLGGQRLELEQSYQEVSGKVLQAGGAGQAISEGRLRGEQIRFTLGTTRYEGRVSGDTMQGTLPDGSAWTARRN
jgi:SAM-dependent methyltransferase